MSNVPSTSTGSRLNFNSPLSADRANRLATELAGQKPATVIEFGCGWGELLLRIVAATPNATAVGIDACGPDLVRGLRNATVRGLADRVSFVEGLAKEHLATADLVISVGAYQAFGSLAEALRELRVVVAPGGRLLLGAEFWESPPTAERLANMWPGITSNDCSDLAGLVDLAVAAGFRPIRIDTVTAGEWEEFESGLLADAEEWLLSHEDHPDAEALRAKADAQRAIWLRGHRGVMGFAYLTLGVATGP